MSTDLRRRPHESLSPSPERMSESVAASDGGGRQLASTATTGNREEKTSKTGSQLKAAVMVQGLTDLAVVTRTLGGFSVSGDVKAIDIASEMRLAGEQAQGGDLSRMESLLVGQAITLNAIFARYAAAAAEAEYLDSAERYMRMAMRAQNQTRMSIETLALVKNPPHPTFIKQANVAHGPQQVNNGGATCAPVQLEPVRNELSPELSHEQPLDTRAARSTANRNPSLATVGEVDGTTNGQRKGKVRAKR